MKPAVYIFFLLSYVSFSQKMDSLLTKNMDSLYNEAIEVWWGDEKDIDIYADALIKKAELLSQKSAFLKAYHIKSLVTSGEESTSYADSLLSLSIDLGAKKYEASAYFIKGRNAYDKRDYKASLENYIETNDILEQTGDSVRLGYLVKDNIALIRLFIGENEQAITIYEELLDYYKERESWENYYLTKFSLAVAYHQNDQFQKSQEIVNSALPAASKNESFTYYYLLSAYSANLYGLGNFGKAIDSMKVANSYFKELDDKTNQAIANYYIGMSYFALDDIRISKYHLKKVDSIFQSDLIVYPITRGAWEKLIDFSKKERNYRKELYYTKSLLKVDSVINENYRNLNHNLQTKYDVPNLILNKERLINKYKNRSKSYIIISVSIGMICALLFFFYFRNQKKKYKAYQKVIENFKKLEDVTLTGKSASISDEVMDRIASGLKELEDANFFINPKANLNQTSKKLDTNSKYLSTYINRNKGKSFTNYVNDLRVVYLINKIRTDLNFRKYTLDAMAKESGFTNYEHMNRAFYKKTDISPSFFLKQIQKEI